MNDGNLGTPSLSSRGSEPFFSFSIVLVSGQHHQFPMDSEAVERERETVKTFNLLVPKVHALGDYPSTIRWLGTTDSYSTQRVSAR